MMVVTLTGDCHNTASRHDHLHAFDCIPLTDSAKCVLAITCVCDTAGKSRMTEQTVELTGTHSSYACSTVVLHSVACSQLQGFKHVKLSVAC
jgi:hypothetical protein